MNWGMERERRLNGLGDGRETKAEWRILKGVGRERMDG